MLYRDFNCKFVRIAGPRALVRSATEADITLGEHFKQPGWYIVLLKLRQVATLPLDIEVVSKRRKLAHPDGWSGPFARPPDAPNVTIKELLRLVKNQHLPVVHRRGDYSCVLVVCLPAQALTSLFYLIGFFNSVGTLQKEIGMGPVVDNNGRNY